MDRSRLLCAVAVVLLWTTAATGEEIELTERSPGRIVGRLSESGVEFSSVLEVPGLALVEVRLPAGTLVRAEIDYLLAEVTLRSLTSDGREQAPLGPHDAALLAELLAALPTAPSGPREAALARTLAYLTAFPAGSVIDIDSSQERDPSARAIQSLCASAGKQRSGTFDVGEKSFTQRVLLGPCYNENNECMGRCGPGCDAPPSRTVQIFAQDCLNHDLCTRKTGTILGECADEWRAAADDFLIGKDCGDLDGNWKDNYKYLWKLTQSVADVRGSVDGAGTEAHCRRWSVSGSHSAASVSLTASSLFQRERCCRAFSLSGKAKSCSSASGTWTNVCGRQGTWSMSRQNGSAAFEFLDEEGEPTSGPGMANEQ